MSARQATDGIVTGGRDGFVKVWAVDVKPNKFGLKVENEESTGLRVYSLKSTNSHLPQAKSVFEHPKTGFVLVGTRGGEIVEFGMTPQENPRMLLKSHYDGEVNGLSPHPKKDQFLMYVSLL